MIGVWGLPRVRRVIAFSNARTVTKKLPGRASGAPSTDLVTVNVKQMATIFISKNKRKNSVERTLVKANWTAQKNGLFETVWPKTAQ